MLSKEQIAAAIKKAEQQARAREQAGARGGSSVRALLYELGYTDVEANQIIKHMASRGFSHCVDPMIATTGVGIEKPEYPAMWACEWGWDQLRSRLSCVL